MRHKIPEKSDNTVIYRDKLKDGCFRVCRYCNICITNRGKRQTFSDIQLVEIIELQGIETTAENQDIVGKEMLKEKQV